MSAPKNRVTSCNWAPSPWFGAKHPTPQGGKEKFSVLALRLGQARDLVAWKLWGGLKMGGLRSFQFSQLHPFHRLVGFEQCFCPAHLSEVVHLLLPFSNKGSSRGGPKTSLAGLETGSLTQIPSTDPASASCAALLPFAQVRPLPNAFRGGGKHSSKDPSWARSKLGLNRPPQLGVKQLRKRHNANTKSENKTDNQK